MTKKLSEDKKNICDILEECGFTLKSVKNYRVQIFVKDSTLVIVEDRNQEG